MKAHQDHTRSCAEWTEDVLLDLADGCLSAEIAERARVHLASCHRCREKAAGAETLLRELGAGFLEEEIAPSAGTRDKILKAVANRQAPSPKAPVASPGPARRSWFLAASVAVLVIASATGFLLALLRNGDSPVPTLPLLDMPDVKHAPETVEKEPAPRPAPPLPAEERRPTPPREVQTRPEPEPVPANPELPDEEVELPSKPHLVPPMDEMPSAPPEKAPRQPVAFVLTGAAGRVWVSDRADDAILQGDVREVQGEIRLESHQDPARLGFGGHVLSLREGTALTLRGFEGAWVVDLERGEVFCEVDPKAKTRFVVASAHGEAEALGTSFGVSVEEGEMRTYVASGRVRVSGKWGEAMVPPGNVAGLAKGTPSVRKPEAFLFHGWLSRLRPDPFASGHHSSWKPGRGRGRTAFGPHHCRNARLKQHHRKMHRWLSERHRKRMKAGPGPHRRPGRGPDRSGNGSRPGGGGGGGR